MPISIAINKASNGHPAESDGGFFRAGTVLALTGFLVFFLILFVPTTYAEIKAVLLSAFLLSIVVGTLNGARFRVHRQVFLLCLFYSCMGMAYVLYGYLNGNPGALKVATVYVIWPLVYMLLISTISQEWVIRGLAQVLIFSSIAISFYALYYLLYVMGVVPSWLYLELDMGQAASFYKGFVEYNLYSIATLLFLVPFISAALLFWQGEKKSPVSHKWLILAFMLVACASVLSGRRALWLVVGLTPILIAVILIFDRQRMAVLRKVKAFSPYLAGMLIVSATVLVLEFGVNPFGMLTTFLAGFQFESDPSASARSEQFFALTADWASRPFFGAGLGAVAEGSIRSEEMPWAYELYFLSVLFQIGIAGFLAYAFGIGWILFYSVKIIRHDPTLRLYLIPVLAGMISFLVASNTNPYLAKFDYLWIVFLPVAIINHYLLKGLPRVISPPETVPTRLTAY